MNVQVLIAYVLMVSVKKVCMRFVLNFLCGNYSFEALKLKYITRLIALTTVVQNVVKAKGFSYIWPSSNYCKYSWGTAVRWITLAIADIFRMM